MCCLHYKLSTLIIIQLRLNNQTVIKKVWNENCTLDTVLKTFTYVITHDGHHIQTFFTLTLGISYISFINEHNSKIFQPPGSKNVLESTHESLYDSAQLQL